MNSNGPRRHKPYTHIEHPAGTVGQGDWCTKCHSSLLNIYFRLSGSYSFTSAEQVFTLHRSVAQNLSDMWRSTFEIGSAQLRFVTEIAPLEQFLCVNRSPIRYDFRGGAKAIRCSVNTTLMTTCIYNALFFHSALIYLSWTNFEVRGHSINKFIVTQGKLLLFLIFVKC